MIDETLDTKDGEIYCLLEYEWDYGSDDSNEGHYELIEIYGPYLKDGVKNKWIEFNKLSKFNCKYIVRKLVA